VDEVGVEGYLEASAGGRPLYKKFRFVAVKENRFELEQYSGRGGGVEVNTVMLRPAKKKFDTDRPALLG
jgi:hypothetical protein